MKKIVNLLKFVIIFVVILVLAGTAFLKRDFIWDQTRMARAFYFVWQGDEALKKDNFQEAIDYYKTALKIYPEHPKAHYNLGNIYFWYELYTAPSEKQPIKTYVYDEEKDKFVLKIEQPEEDGDTENSAEAAYIKATEVYPDFINAWINLGLVRAMKYDMDGAIKAFMKAVNANPITLEIPFIFNNAPSIKYNRSVGYYNLGYVYNQLAQSSEFDAIRRDYYLEAMDYYKKSYEINPDNYKTNYNLAHTYQLLDRQANAINQYCKAIKLDPIKFEAHYNLGLVLKRQQRYMAAADELKKAAMMLDSGKNADRLEYVFRILTDTSYRAASMELSQRRQFLKEFYPIPQKGIIAEVIGKPLLEEQKKNKAEQQAKLAQDVAEQKKKDKEENKKTTQLDETYKELSTCVTDPDYYEKLKQKFEQRPDWIELGLMPAEYDIYRDGL
jgi:tetratricopeptide (TPR) repeat protein